MLTIFKNLTKKDLQLPKFNKQFFLIALLMLILPNLLFLAVAFFAKTSRPIVDVDYFIALILFCIPNRFVKLIASVLFVAAFFFDVVMFVIQLFPFMDLAGFLYFAPFLKTAPALFQMGALLGVLLIFIVPFILWKLSHKTNLYHILLIIIPLSVVGYFTQHLMYHQKNAQFEVFGENNFYYVNSQFKLYHYNKGISFVESADTSPKFSAYKGNTASANLQNSDKILFIVAESWGRFKNPALHEKIISGIIGQKDRMAYFEQGEFPFIDATVNGELRELCHLHVVGYALNEVTTELKDCLPHRLAKNGYKTYSLHGASGQLYERYSWYPKAGFNHVNFSENFMNKKSCTAFRGVCDTELFDFVSDVLAKENKVFFYWLTLTSHFPYPVEDLNQQSDLVCQDYGMPEDHYLCKNAKLQKQFFDKLGTLLQDSGMHGVEVVVVGDHTPPTDSNIASVKYLNDTNVAWLHFKVK